MDRRALVTGGSGFIGAAVVRRLTAAGYWVRVLDDNSRGRARRLAGLEADVEFVQADVRDGEAVRRAAAGVDVVVHLAYVNGTEFFYRFPELVLDVGIRGMLNVLDACREEDVGHLVVASSSEVYQEPDRIPTPEDTQLVIPDVLNARYSYAGGKLASELLTINWGRTGFDRVTVFRPHNVYGPDMGWEHVIPQLALRALETHERLESRTLPFSIQGDGSDTRAFMHISDCASAVERLVEQGEHLGIYHVGNPEEITIKALAEEIGRILDLRLDIRAGERPAGSPRRRCPDITKLRQLGFEPRVPLSEGLPATVNWYRDNRNLAPARE